MKRQRKKEGPTAPAIGKKTKKPNATADPVDQTQEETPVAAATAAVVESEAMVMPEDSEWEWWMNGGEVEEEMSWGCVWLQGLDVEFVGENYGVLFSDVQWDDDIWNLKSVTEVPR